MAEIEFSRQGELAAFLCLGLFRHARALVAAMVAGATIVVGPASPDGASK